MSDELFILCQDDLGNYEIRHDEEIFHFLWEVAPILNEQQATIDKQDKAIREALKVLADSKNYQSVISFKYGLQYATKLLKRVIDDE